MRTTENARLPDPADPGGKYASLRIYVVTMEPALAAGHESAPRGANGAGCDYWDDDKPAA